jgi:hypothetical protein
VIHRDQIKGAKKDVVGTDYPPVGTKDFASYIAKIRQSKAEGVYLALPGQDATIYLKQAHQFGLNQEVKPIAGILELENMRRWATPWWGHRQLAILHGRHAEEPRVRQALPRSARHVSRHVRRRDL